MAHFVTVWDKTTGFKRPHPVPAHWVDHPILGKNLTVTPPAPAQEPTPKKSSNKENK